MMVQHLMRRQTSCCEPKMPTRRIFRHPKASEELHSPQTSTDRLKASAVESWRRFRPSPCLQLLQASSPCPPHTSCRKKTMPKWCCLKMRYPKSNGYSSLSLLQRPFWGYTPMFWQAQSLLCHKYIQISQLYPRYGWCSRPNIHIVHSRPPAVRLWHWLHHLCVAEGWGP